MPTPKKRAPTPEKTTGSTEQAVTSQPFPWLSSKVPLSVSTQSAARSQEVRRREISERASLLRRLGYSKSEVLLRLNGAQEWEYEPFHTSPLSTEISALVEAVFAPAKGRVTSLEP